MSVSVSACVCVSDIREILEDLELGVVTVLDEPEGPKYDIEVKEKGRKREAKQLRLWMQH